ncbi:MAG: FtsX-like permease family protein [Candidatus Margulisiibacteriota bacterium]|jgi:ABC-type lipoprotein release transport system permease subunit
MFRLAVKNILNTAWGLLTVLGFAVAVALAVLSWSLVRQVADGTAGNIAYYRSGHLRVVDRQYNDRLFPLAKSFAKYQEIERLAAQYQEVTLQTERIKIKLLLQNQGRSLPAQGIAIDATRERPVWRTLAGRQVGVSAKELVIGKGLAQKLEVGLGDKLTIVAQNALGAVTLFDLEVVGIFSSGAASIDDGTFFFPLAAAQKVFALNDKVSEVVIYLRDPAFAGEAAEYLGDELERVAPGRFTVIPREKDAAMIWLEKGRLIGLAFSGLLLFLGCTLLYHFFSSSVAERDREIKTLKRLGVKKGELARLFFYEAALIGLLAGLIGGALALIVNQVGWTVPLGWAGLDFVPLEIEPGIKWSDLFLGLGGSLGFSCLGMLVPAWRGLR